MHLVGGHLSIGCPRRAMGGRRARAIFPVFLLLLMSFVPIVSADATITLSSNTMAQEADTDNPAEYTITVRNTGSDDVTVSLSTVQGEGCQGFTSNIEQISGTISSGSSESTTLTVTVGQGADGDCETTVQGTAQVAPPAAPGAPGQDEITVTTTAGSGGGVYGVSLSTPQPTKEYSSSDGEEVEWTVTVENTGQQAESVSLSMDDDGSCDSDDLSATVEPETVNLQSSGDTEDVTVTVDLPNGASTSADSHCFILRAVVTQDQQNPSGGAEDNLSLTLNVPERKECIASLSPASLSVDPGEVATTTFTVTNDGNTQWSVSTDTSGANQDWVSFSGASSGLISEGESRSFQLEVFPDDSIESGSSTLITVKGMDGTSLKCDATLSVQVGQSHAANLQISTGFVSNVDPGTSAINSVSITNEGNGQDTFVLGGSVQYVGQSGAPNGWSVSFASSSLSLNSRHATSGSSQSVEVQVSVPSDARADQDVEVTISASSSLASSLGTLSVQTFRISVAQIHELTVSTSVGNGEIMTQTGSAGQIVRFPFNIMNDGNIQDNFLFEACDDGVKNDCISPSWNTRFVDIQGNQISQMLIDPGQTATLELQVTVDSGAFEFEEEEFRAQVYIQGNTNKVDSASFKVRVSNYDYSASIAFADPGDDPDSLDIALAPRMAYSFDVLVSNSGNSSFEDEGMLSFSGMEGLVEVVFTRNGTEVDGPFVMKSPSSEPMVFTVTLSLLPAAEDGDYGTLNLNAASMNDAANPNTIQVLLSIATVYDIDVRVLTESTQEVNIGSSVQYEINVTNIGNARAEYTVNLSDGLRGWTLTHDMEDSFFLNPGESQTVLVKASPPIGIVGEDRLPFVVRVEPVNSPLDGVPLDLVAIGVEPTWEIN
ncbi:MAG: hypothetical protein CMB31_00825 [Euryarchaeota archaeon]|nr:hypothetical protein [Euryarchaeota archaeon]